MSTAYSSWLSSLGWSNEQNQQFNNFLEARNLNPEQHLPALVINQERDRYRIQVSDSKILWSEIRGKLRYESQDHSDFPAVGDWVVVYVDKSGESVVIEGVLPRRSALVRKGVLGIGVQVIATNMNYIFITSSLNQDLNLNRLDRYLTLSWDSGAIPVLLLTKRDLNQDWPQVVAQLGRHFLGVEIFAVSSKEPESFHQLVRFMGVGDWSVVVGSSGVGKSTLINALVGQEVLKTEGIREDDDKGKHTTTSRSMWRSQYGGFVIDTPGMRELQLLDNEDGLDHAFSDVVSLFDKCKFSDCQHETEPRCAVRKALESGQLSEVRWKSYQKLQREIAFEARKASKSLAAQEKQKWKQIHKSLKQKLKARGR